MVDLLVRTVTEHDAAGVSRIYSHHVQHGTATFDTEAPNEADWCEKIAFIVGRGWPFLVARDHDIVVGYAYATQFRDRPAYSHTCENSIYVAPDRIGLGIGSLLLLALIDSARESAFTQMIAVIGGGEPASIALHAKLGFVETGRMKKVGLKFGRLLDTVYMQRALSPSQTRTPSPALSQTGPASDHAVMSD